MCRSIKQLRNPTQPPNDAEIEAAALQFVRKVSGYRVPSVANQAAFDAAVAEIAGATRRLLDNLAVRGQALRRRAAQTRGGSDNQRNLLWHIIRPFQAIASFSGNPCHCSMVKKYLSTRRAARSFF